MHVGAPWHQISWRIACSDICALAARSTLRRPWDSYNRRTHAHRLLGLRTRGVCGVQYDKLVDKRIVVVVDGWEVDSMYPTGHYTRTLGSIGDRDTETEVQPPPLGRAPPPPHHHTPPHMHACPGDCAVACSGGVGGGGRL